MLMKKKRSHVNAELLDKLRQEETRLAASPSTDGYLTLADWRQCARHWNAWTFCAQCGQWPRLV